jgi:hypothetical protein
MPSREDIDNIQAQQPWAPSPGNAVRSRQVQQIPRRVVAGGSHLVRRSLSAHRARRVIAACTPRSYVPAEQAQLTRTVEAQRWPGDLGAIWPMRGSVPSMKAWARSARRRLRLRA